MTKTQQEIAKLKTESKKRKEKMRALFEYMDRRAKILDKKMKKLTGMTSRMHAIKNGLDPKYLEPETY